MWACGNGVDGRRSGRVVTVIPFVIVNQATILREEFLRRSYQYCIAAAAALFYPEVLIGQGDELIRSAGGCKLYIL